MSEEIKTDTPVVEQQQTPPVVRTPFDEESWGTTPVNTAASTEAKPEIKTEPTVEDEILDPKDWLKRELDVDDIAVLKAEREEFKKLKESPQSFKFENEQSEQLYNLLKEGKKSEVRDFLEKQEKIEKLTTAEVDDLTSDEIIKMGMAAKYKDLTPEQIDYKFNKQFGIPKEPVQGDLEDDDDFKVRKAEWEQTVADVKMEKLIEAKLMKPELEKLKSELRLPDITEKDNAEKKPTQEELEAFEKAKSSFAQSVEQALNGFNGIAQQVKDKDVDYTVSYSPSTEEKTFVNGKLKEFAESGFDANSLFTDRWVSEDGKTLKVEQMVKDLSMLYSDERISQKLVTDAANKRLEAYLMEKKQTNVNGVSSNGMLHLNQDNKTEMDKLRDFVFDN